ncbi:MAG: anthranilate phosphoribosyltransferase [Proteobacteria bacterium]|nr:anthranilate phosphoribosyltransferase [Pseudomonadota bacterium]
MTLLTSHNPIRPLPADTAAELMRTFVDQDTDALLVGACLALLAQRDPSAEELHAFASVLLAEAQPFDRGDVAVLDVVGTGGDGASTPNLSTLSSLLLGHLGVPVAKHGNRAATSTCGSADLMEALGYDLARSPSQLKQDLTDHSFAFLFAPAYHPLLGRLREIRRRLGIPTIFNLLGPLLNPARPAYQVLGVNRDTLLEPMAGALSQLGLQRGFVIHGKCAEGNGMDEASIEGPTRVLELRDGELKSIEVLVPRDLGITAPDRGALRIDDRAQALAVARGCLHGSTSADFRPAVADAVALQAGLGLLLHRNASLSELPAAMHECRNVLENGFEPPLPAREIAA